MTSRSQPLIRPRKHLHTEATGRQGMKVDAEVDMTAPMELDDFPSIPNPDEAETDVEEA